jgi:hypothetical protein
LVILQEWNKEAAWKLTIAFIFGSRSDFLAVGCYMKRALKRFLALGPANIATIVHFSTGSFSAGVRLTGSVPIIDELL